MLFLSNKEKAYTFANKVRYENTDFFIKMIFLLYTISKYVIIYFTAKNIYRILIYRKRILYMKKHYEVAAALICEGDRLLIGKRPATKPNPLLWEFVGGKKEDGETLVQTLIRECREEIGVTVTVGDIFFQTTHEYPDSIVHLTVFYTKITEGTPVAREHEALTWITAGEIPQYKFCPADTEMLDLLQRGASEK